MGGSTSTGYGSNFDTEDEYADLTSRKKDLEHLASGKLRGFAFIGTVVAVKTKRNSPASKGKDTFSVYQGLLGIEKTKNGYKVIAIKTRTGATGKKFLHDFKSGSYQWSLDYSLHEPNKSVSSQLRSHPFISIYTVIGSNFDELRIYHPRVRL